MSEAESRPDSSPPQQAPSATDVPPTADAPTTALPNGDGVEADDSAASSHGGGSDDSSSSSDDDHDDNANGKAAELAAAAATTAPPTSSPLPLQSAPAAATLDTAAMFQAFMALQQQQQLASSAVASSAAPPAGAAAVVDPQAFAAFQTMMQMLNANNQAEREERRRRKKEKKEKKKAKKAARKATEAAAKAAVVATPKESKPRRRKEKPEGPPSIVSPSAATEMGGTQLEHDGISVADGPASPLPRIDQDPRSDRQILQDFEAAGHTEDSIPLSLLPMADAAQPEAPAATAVPSITDEGGAGTAATAAAADEATPQGRGSRKGPTDATPKAPQSTPKGKKQPPAPSPGTKSLFHFGIKATAAAPPHGGLGTGGSGGDAPLFLPFEEMARRRYPQALKAWLHAAVQNQTAVAATSDPTATTAESASISAPAVKPYRFETDAGRWGPSLWRDTAHTVVSTDASPAERLARRRLEAAAGFADDPNTSVVAVEEVVCAPPPLTVAPGRPSLGEPFFPQDRRRMVNVLDDPLAYVVLGEATVSAHRKQASDDASIHDPEMSLLLGTDSNRYVHRYGHGSSGTTTVPSPDGAAPTPAPPRFSTEVVFSGFYSINYEPFEARPAYFGTFNNPLLPPAAASGGSGTDTATTKTAQSFLNDDDRAMGLPFEGDGRRSGWPSFGMPQQGGASGTGGAALSVQAFARFPRGEEMAQLEAVDYCEDSAEDWDSEPSEADDALASSSGGSSSDDIDSNDPDFLAEMGGFIHDGPVSDVGDSDDDEDQRILCERERKRKRLLQSNCLSAVAYGPFGHLSLPQHPFHSGYDFVEQLAHLRVGKVDKKATRLTATQLRALEQQGAAVPAPGMVTDDGPRSEDGGDEADDDNPAAATTTDGERHSRTPETVAHQQALWTCCNRNAIMPNLCAVYGLLLERELFAAGLASKEEIAEVVLARARAHAHAHPTGDDATGDPMESLCGHLADISAPVSAEEEAKQAQAMLRGRLDASAEDMAAVTQMVREVPFGGYSALLQAVRAAQLCLGVTDTKLWSAFREAFVLGKPRLLGSSAVVPAPTGTSEATTEVEGPSSVAASSAPPLPTAAAAIPSLPPTQKRLLPRGDFTAEELAVLEETLDLTPADLYAIDELVADPPKATFIAVEQAITAAGLCVGVALHKVQAHLRATYIRSGKFLAPRALFSAEALQELERKRRSAGQKRPAADLPGDDAAPPGPSSTDPPIPNPVPTQGSSVADASAAVPAAEASPQHATSDHSCATQAHPSAAAPEMTAAATSASPAAVPASPLAAAAAVRARSTKGGPRKAAPSAKDQQKGSSDAEAAAAAAPSLQEQVGHRPVALPNAATMLNAFSYLNENSETDDTPN